MTTINEASSAVRDELARLISSRHTMAAADAILAAGYRKPRTITTVEELGALPEGAIYLSGHREVMRANGAGWDPSNLDSGWLADPADIPLPVTVIWEPEVLVAA